MSRFNLSSAVALLSLALFFCTSIPSASAYPLASLFLRRSPQPLPIAAGPSYSIANNGGNLDAPNTVTVTVTATSTEAAPVTVTITQQAATVTTTACPLATSTFDDGLWDPTKYVTVFFTTTATQIADAPAVTPASD